MTTTFLTAYVMIWPVLVAGVLYVLVSAFMREWKRTRARKHSIV